LACCIRHRRAAWRLICDMRHDITMRDAPEIDVTTLALLNLIRLLAAELVAGEHRHDVEKVIAAIDRKLNSTPLPRGTDMNDARAGITRARELLRPYVAHLRDRARAAQMKSRPRLLQ
jgi:hypothetical protein